MWIFLICALVLIALVFGWGFFEYQFERVVLYPQTNVAVELCVEKNKTDNVSTAIIEKLCAAAESKPITATNGGLSGRASPSAESGGYFEGFVTNDFKEYIVTGYDIAVDHYQVDKTQLDSEEELDVPSPQRNTYSVRNIWLEPEKTDQFKSFGEDSNLIPDMSIYENDAVDFSWYITNVEGVQISIR
jgi:hypothetical protein